MADMLTFLAYVNLISWVVSTPRLSKHLYQCAFGSSEYTSHTICTHRKFSPVGTYKTLVPLNDAHGGRIGARIGYMTWSSISRAIWN